MAKRFAITNFILVTIFVALGLVLSFVQFRIPGTVNNFTGFFNAIAKGYDFGQSQTAVYELVPESDSVETLTDEQKENALEYVKFVIDNNESSFNLISNQGENKLRVVVSKSETSETILNALAERTDIVIRGSETTEATKYDVHSSGIRKAYPSYQQDESTSGYTLGVVIEFNENGKLAYEKLTEYVATTSAQTLYFYTADGTQIGTQPNITRKQTSGQVFMPNSSLKTEAAANTYAINVMMSSLDVSLKLVENSVTTSAFGMDALKYVMIALAIALVVMIVLLIVRYKALGLISLLSIALSFVLYTILIQSYPMICMSNAGLLGFVLGMSLIIFGHVIVFEKIKKEYAQGKTIPLSVKLGFKGSLVNVLDMVAIPAIVSAVMFIAGTEMIKELAITLLTGSILTLFICLVMTRVFVKWYTVINNKNAAALGLKKEEAKDEK